MSRFLVLIFATISLHSFSLVGAAKAQLFWDWGGGDQRDASGRELVRFSPQFQPGEIIVSFGDRRLYFITRPGEAIS
jgi:hypothetical protein